MLDEDASSYVPGDKEGILKDMELLAYIADGLSPDLTHSQTRANILLIWELTNRAIEIFEGEPWPLVANDDAVRDVCPLCGGRVVCVAEYVPEVGLYKTEWPCKKSLGDFPSCEYKKLLNP